MFRLRRQKVGSNGNNESAEAESSPSATDAAWPDGNTIPGMEGWKAGKVLYGGKGYGNSLLRVVEDSEGNTMVSKTLYSTVDAKFLPNIISRSLPESFVLDIGDLNAVRFEDETGKPVIYIPGDEETAAEEYRLPTSSFDDGSHSLRAIREAIVGTKTKHPNIIKPLLKILFTRDVPYYFNVQDRASPTYKITIFMPEIKANLYEELKIVEDESDANDKKISLIHKLHGIADALDYLHNCRPRILHRDVKLENIFIGYDDELMLGDAGMALIGSDTVGSRYGTGGTFYTISPEQFKSSANAVPASDQFSYAAVLAEALYGDIALERPNLLDINEQEKYMDWLLEREGSTSELKHDFVQHVSTNLGIELDTAKALGYVLDKALSIDPEQRFANCRIVSALVNGLLDKDTNSEYVDLVKLLTLSSINDRSKLIGVVKDQLLGMNKEFLKSFVSESGYVIGDNGLQVEEFAKFLLNVQSSV